MSGQLVKKIVLPPRSQGVESPIALTYSVTLSVGQVSRPSEQLSFKNPYRAPMWVDELHFEIQSGPSFGSDSANLYTTRTPPEAVSMRLKLNNKYIVEDFVPLFLLAPKTDTSERHNAGGSLGQLQAVPSRVCSFFYRLAKPMWVEELDDLLMELRLDSTLVALGYNATQQPIVTVTMCGRSTLNSRRPKQRYLPFNVRWQPDVFSSAVNVETTVRSPDSALHNGNKRAAVITRMLGDMRSWLNDVPNVLGCDSAMLLALRISHSGGYYLVKDLTPFYELFENTSRALELKFVLQPGEFLTLELQTDKLAETVPAYILDSPRYWGGFSLQGYTVEDL